MATINLTGTTVTSGVPDARGEALRGEGKPYVMRKTLDLTPFNSTTAATSGGLTLTITAADILQVLSIPADTLVQQVKIKMITPAVGTTLSADIGDGSDPNGWDDAMSLKGAAGTVTTSAVGTDALAASATMGTFYDTADTIDVTFNTVTAITAGPKFTIYAYCVDYNGT